MKRKMILVITSFLSVIVCQAQEEWKKPDIPSVNVPVFKTDTFNIINYGAVGDGLTMNTRAFADAIGTCARNGGGVVVVPSGLWLTGPVVLKSNVNLHLDKGALVLFSRNFDDYPMILSYYEGLEAWRCQSPVSAVRQQNIAITGPGVMDGSGDSWRMVKKSKLTAAQWSDLLTTGGVLNKEKNTWYPSDKSLKGNELYRNEQLPPITDSAAYAGIKDFLRPVMISLVECRNVLLDGPTFQNSPSWCIHPLLCEHLTVKNVNARNPWYAQNGDGIDIESCRNGIVDNCTFDVGDDGICIKSGRNEEGRKRGRPTENFIITNNIVYHGHGGFVIGSEMSGGVRNIYVANCTFLGTDIGLRFKSTRGRGGVVENIVIENISMINIPAEAIRFDMFYSGTSPISEGDEKIKPMDSLKTFVADDGTPVFRRFRIRNVNCNGAKQAIFLQGLPEMKISNIMIENSSFKADQGFSCIDGKDICLKDVKMDVRMGHAAFIDNSSNVVIDNINATYQNGKLLKVKGKNSFRISISSSKGKIPQSEIEKGNEVTSELLVK